MNEINLHQTRSLPQSLSSVETIQRVVTRSDSEDSILYYIVNFGNDEGFAILSADNRLLPVYAFSNEGSISLNDTTEDKILDSYIKSLPRNPEVNPLVITDPIQNYGYERLVAPFIPTGMRPLSQKTPFNSYTPSCSNSIGSNGHYFTGCAPVAMTAFMACYQYPTTINGTTINWNAIRTSCSPSDVISLQSAFCNSKYLGLTYDPSDGGASCSSEKIISAFNKLGYSSSVETDFNSTDIVNILKTKKPVFLIGKNTSAGHAWVLDGLFAYYTTSLSPIVGAPNIKTYTNYYYHCFWGWAGSHNGYFAFSNGMGYDPVKTESYEDGERSPYFFNKVTYLKNLSH